MRSRLTRILAAAAAAGGLAIAALPAHAGSNVFWSIGIQLPPIGTVVSNAPPVYAPPPVVYAPPPVIVHPAPVVYGPPPVVVHRPPRVVYAPPPRVVYAPPPAYVGWAPPGHVRKWKDRDRDGIHDRHDRWDDRRGRGW